MVNGDRGVGLEAAELLEVDGVKVAGGSGDDGSVVGAELEADAGPGIREHCRSDRRRELGQVLVGQRQAEAETACLGEDVGEVCGQVEVVLELVDEGHDWVATLSWNVDSLEGGVPELSDDERAEQSSGLAAELTLGQRHEQDAPLGEDVSHVEARGRLTDHGSHARAEEKGSELVHHGRDCLMAFGL